MRKRDEDAIKSIQELYEQSDNAQEFSNNILLFPTGLSATGKSILDDAEHLLMFADYRGLVEERLLCALQEIAKEIINVNGEQNG